MCEKYGYRVQEHKVITEDGYILGIFHIAGNKGNPILLMHGLLDSSDTFILRGNTSLVATLANNGYDVWVGNVRGNSHSTGHLVLDINHPKYWNFSYHEHGIYDLPATIDYILKETEQQQVVILGHSQGNFITLVMASERPQYNDKVKLLVSLAPIFYMSKPHPVMKRITRTAPFIYKAAAASNVMSLFGKNTFLFRLIQGLCTSDIGYYLCWNGLFATVFGEDSAEIEPDFNKVIMAHCPQVTSLKNMYHAAQIIIRGRVRKFDYGPAENMRVYGTKISPEYDLSKVTMKIAFIAAENDAFSSLEDVKRLKRKLANVVAYEIVPRRQFNHIDYIWGLTTHKTLHPIILKLLTKFPYDLTNLV